MNNIESMIEQLSAQAIVDACVRLIGRVGFAVSDPALMDLRKPGAKPSAPQHKPDLPDDTKSSRCPCGKPSYARDGTCRSCCQRRSREKTAPQSSKPVQNPAAEPALARCRTSGCPGVAVRVGLCLSCYQAQQASAKARLAAINARASRPEPAVALAETAPKLIV